MRYQNLTKIENNRYYFFLLYLNCLRFYTECGKPNVLASRRGYIAGGVNAKQGTWPWMVNNSNLAFFLHIQ